MVKWTDLSAEKSSIMGLFFGKYILATSSMRESFMLAYGCDRKYFKIIFINCLTNEHFVKRFNDEDITKQTAEKIAYALEENKSKDVLDKYGFEKVH